jgi:predicted P-loop ATPase
MTRPDWINTMCQLNDKGNPAPNLFNAMVGLRVDPRLCNSIAYDEFACSPVMLHELAEPGNDIEPRRLTDKDIADVQELLQDCAIRSLSMATTHQAIHSYAHEQPFHPVKDYFATLDWDGTPRIREWLSTYAGAEMSDYTCAIGQMFIVSMIARILKPGCKADHMLVLEGPQGKLKSTLLNVLANPWFSDDIPEIGHKDAKLHLRGNWLIEVAELHAFNKADALLLKSFLSRRVEKFRPPFAREEVAEPRQNVFAGTTNREAYLHDETGNRRFWPFLCAHRIDVDGLHRDRDQLLGEALHAFRAGTRWWPSHDFEATTIKPQQDARYEADEWQDPIAQFLTTDQGVSQIGATTIGNIAHRALGFADQSRLGMREQNRIRACLKTIGWEPGSRGHGGVRLWRRKSVTSGLNEINDLFGGGDER